MRSASGRLQVTSRPHVSTHVYWSSSTLLSDRVIDPSLKEIEIHHRALEIAIGRVNLGSVIGITDNDQGLYQADFKSLVDPMIAPMSG